MKVKYYEKLKRIFKFHKPRIKNCVIYDCTVRISGRNDIVNCKVI